MSVGSERSVRLFNKVRNSDLAWFITNDPKAQPAYAQYKLIHIRHTKHKICGSRWTCELQTKYNVNLYLDFKDR